MKRVWITRINAAARQYHWNYSRFWPALSTPAVGVNLNRKVLADLCATEPFAFKAIVDTVQQASGIEPSKAVYDADLEEWDFDEEEDMEADEYDSDYEEWKAMGEAQAS